MNLPKLGVYKGTMAFARVLPQPGVKLVDKVCEGLIAKGDLRGDGARAMVYGPRRR